MADDLENMSLKDLERGMDEALNPPPVTPTEPEPAQAPEAQVEEAASPTPETPQEPQPEAQAPDDMELLRSELSETLSRVKHFEQVAGRNAGENGFLKQQIARLESQLHSVRAGEDQGEYQRPQENAPPQPTIKSDPLTTWAIQQAVEKAGYLFTQANPDVGEHWQGMQEYMGKFNPDTNPILNSNNPMEAQEGATRMLQEAYWHVRANKEAARRQELLQRRADQTSKLAQAKQLASVSGSGSAPPPKPKEKSMDEMSFEELEREMLKQTGGRW